MAGILFIVTVPKKEYENKLREHNKPLIEKYKIASQVINELKEKQQSYNEDDTVVIKCQSTECLHNYSKESEPYKCKSEINLTNGLEDSHKSFAKTSWKEIKQVISPNKQKLKISRPVRGIDILGAFQSDTPLEIILSEIVSRLDIKNAAWNTTRDEKFWQVIFSIESGNLSEELIQVLKTFGIGSSFQSSVSLLPCALYFKSNDMNIDIYDRERTSSPNSAWSRFSSSVGNRTNLAQVLHDVRANGALTFDWVFMLLVAAFVATIGLIEDSTVVLVASMLISPLMGPITAGTLGTAVRDRSLQLMGVTNEFLGLFLCLCVGFIVGMTVCILDESYGVVDEWPTDEMLSRCAHRSLWIGVLVAIPCGAGCALAVLGDYTSSLVGVAISASLLPPAVNAGLLWSMALFRLVIKTEQTHWLVVLPSELALLGTASLCLTLVNIICIFLSGLSVYKVKEVRSMEKRDMFWWKKNQVNRARFSSLKTHSKEKFEWDAYTAWCASALESKEKRHTRNSLNNNENKKIIHPVETVSTLVKESLPRYKTTSMKEYCHQLQLEDNYIPVSSEIKLEMENQMISPQNISANNDNNIKNRHSYNNLAFESNKSNLPCLDSAPLSHGPLIRPPIIADSSI